MEAEAYWSYLITIALIIFMKVVCFILGYLTIRLGYNLISSGVKGEFKFSTSLGGVKADLASISPGLLFVLLGVFLIAFAIYVKKEAYLEKIPSSNLEEQEFDDPIEKDFYLDETEEVK
ncbi:MAG: hypothetical protein GY839_00615 [candidate division Zixibacteria bacterium]|nr:hypothetical protein [candidate division Zixibacteria bacterium]